MGLLEKFVARFRSVPAPEFMNFESRIEVDDTDEAIVHEPDIPDFSSKPSMGRSGPTLVTSAFRGVVAAIEYMDADGETSFRRISLGDVVQWPNGSKTIYAHCFERKAPRSFRIDRIQCFFDQDGVVTDPSEFFEKMELRAGERVADLLSNGNFLLVLQQLVFEELVVLVALARCDFSVHPEELEVLIQHFVYAIEDTGVICDADTVVGLKGAIARFFPTPWDLERAITRLRRLPNQRLRAFRRTVRALVEADGRIAEEEYDLVRELSGRGAI